ncbi:hypothetical protein [Curtobacterium sp. MCBA15_001]|uniref:hypothetical protein n=1 Tax=Curtobacterium sp. MCBA15_001 TaxID=1898731 RepID=UPI0015878C77|nr:hypothetical protein [Curtobacterium sp. MCBA15_001]
MSGQLRRTAALRNAAATAFADALGAGSGADGPDRPGTVTNATAAMSSKTTDNQRKIKRRMTASIIAAHHQPLVHRVSEFTAAQASESTAARTSVSV